MVTQAPINARQSAWIRALDRARLVATRKPHYRPSTDSYRVHSDHSGNDYAVSPIIRAGHVDYTCTCQAGVKGQVCWHAALIAALPHEITRRQRQREAVKALAACPGFLKLHAAAPGSNVQSHWCPACEPAN